MKVFISQPMKGKKINEIIAERKTAVSVIRSICGKDAIIIDSDIITDKTDATPLWYLGKSIERMASADVAFFCKGWKKHRGCAIEHTCALAYGLRVLTVVDDYEHGTIVKVSEARNNE